MITPEMIQRINELARKQKDTGLTNEEREEQALLRRAYVDCIKEQVKIQLEAIKPKFHTHNYNCDCQHKH